jgi:YD repeat-containing protein
MDELIKTTRAAQFNLAYDPNHPEPTSGNAPLPKAYGFVTTNTYDANGQLVATATEDRGKTTGCSYTVDQRIRYDILGNRVAEGHEVNDDVFTTTTYYYDAAGRQVLTVHPEGNADFTNTTHWAAPPNHPRIDESANTALSRSAVQNCQCADAFNRSHRAPSTNFNYYDAKGHLSRSGDGITTHTYAYDDFGRKIAEWTLNDPLWRKTSWKYDAFGQLLAMKVEGRTSTDSGATTNTLEVPITFMTRAVARFR